MSHKLAHDGSEPAIVVEHGLARRVAAEAEPSGVLVLQQLKGMLCLGPGRLEDLAERVDHGWVCLLMWFAIPAIIRTNGHHEAQI